MAPLKEMHTILEKVKYLKALPLNLSSIEYFDSLHNHSHDE
jgi:hypothetical protein